MEKFYFTYGTWSGYPYQGGWSIVCADDIREAIQIFKEAHPTPENILNCADYYKAEDFESTEIFTKGNFGKYTQEIILKEIEK